ncbi:MAG: hypothetical protein JWN73_848 [Betaproteobacteria bacterium]|nr:hypothetical protein [Betaproteobacteria bacterium]
MRTHATSPAPTATPIAALSAKVPCKICGADAPFFGNGENVQFAWRGNPACYSCLVKE